MLKTATMPRTTGGNAPASRTIVCVYCRKPQQVGAIAKSLPCRFCHKALLLEDILIPGYEAKRVIETCGTITIGPKGDVTVNSLVCAGLGVAGKLKGNVTCLGPVSIAAGAMVRGDVTAMSVEIAPGARLDGKYSVVGEPPPISVPTTDPTVDLKKNRPAR